MLQCSGERIDRRQSRTCGHAEGVGERHSIFVWAIINQELESGVGISRVA